MDNGVVNSDQSQTNLPNNNLSNNPADSITPVPSSDNPSNQYPNNTAVEQNDQLPHNAPPQLTQADNSSLPQPESGDLLEIKRSALQSLLPIVGKLDQSPEERFQTLLMVIQASDNSELIKEAYETAAKISDEGKRAQALLAIINEINFFTQPTSQN
jgi:hypothetical protein